MSNQVNIEDVEDLGTLKNTELIDRDYELVKDHFKLKDISTYWRTNPDTYKFKSFLHAQRMILLAAAESHLTETGDKEKVAEYIARSAEIQRIINFIDKGSFELTTK